MTEKLLETAAYVLRLTAFIGSVKLAVEFYAYSRQHGGRLPWALFFLFAAMALSIGYFLIGTLIFWGFDARTLLRWSVIGWLPLNIGLWWLWWAIRGPMLTLNPPPGSREATP